MGVWRPRHAAHLSSPSSPSGGRLRDPGTRCTDLVPYGGLNSRSAFVTPEGNGRKSEVPGVSVTRSLSGDGSSTLPSPSRDRSSTPRTLGRLGHGHSLPGPWPRRPFPSRAPASDGRAPSRGASFRRPGPFSTTQARGGDAGSARRPRAPRALRPRCRREGRPGALAPRPRRRRPGARSESRRRRGGPRRRGPR